MERVYLLHNGTYLRKNGENLVLLKDQKVIEEIPLHSLDHLVLAGYTSLSGAVLNALINKRVETVFLDRNYQFKARLNLDEHKHVLRRQKQYLRISEQGFATKTAKMIVQAKLRNQARYINIRGKSLQSDSLLSWAAAIRTIAKHLNGTNNMDVIRGAEGHGSRLYFQAMALILKDSGFSFSERNRRPPLDPVNALLSFCYTLLTNEVLTAIKIVGLDPYLGCLHEVAYGRPSLACDLVEEWRTFLGDRLILGLINKGTVNPGDFIYRDIKNTDFVDEEELKEKRPVEMKPNICRAFLQSYERWMQKKIKDPIQGDHTSYRHLILRQVRRFEQYLNDEISEYESFPWSKLR